MLRTRILAAAIFTPVVFGALWYGSWPLALLCLLVAGLALWEYFGMSSCGLRWDQGWGLALGLALAGLTLAGSIPDRAWPLVLPGLTLASALLVVLRPLPLELGITRSAALTFGVLYGGVLITFLYTLRQGPDGLFWAMCALFAVWGCDTGAYFAGRLLGRRPFAPALSPKKTIEGFFGGIAAAVGVALLCWWLFEPAAVTPWVAAGLGAVAGIFGPIGDLAESLLKRSAGVKDSGRVLPGHGGVLDRFDAVLFVAPLFEMLRRAAGSGSVFG